MTGTLELPRIDSGFIKKGVVHEDKAKFKWCLPGKIDAAAKALETFGHVEIVEERIVVEGSVLQQTRAEQKLAPSRGGAAMPKNIEESPGERREAVIVYPCCFQFRRAFALCLSFGRKITGLRMMASDFEPGDHVNEGAAFPMSDIAGEIWMKFGAIKVLMLLFIDYTGLIARRELESSLETVEAPWSGWGIKKKDAEN